MLSEKTLIPLGLAIATIGGASIWLTTIYVNLGTASADIREIKADQREYTRHLQEIRQELAEIKAALKRR